MWYLIVSIPDLCTLTYFDVNDVKAFQNPTGRSLFDHFLDQQSMPRLFRTIIRWLIQTLLLLILFQQFTTWGQAGYAHTKMM